MMESPTITASHQRYREFMNNVVKLQRDEKMSDEAFGEYCEVGRCTWQRIKRQACGINGLTMLRISIATGISI